VTAVRPAAASGRAGPDSQTPERQSTTARLIEGLRNKTAAHATNAPRREAGYTISNALGDEAVIRIYDEIWWLGVNAIDLIAELDQITASVIRVEINSPGGDVFDGIAIYNALRSHPAKVTTRVDGIAASIASVIFQAGDRRVVQPSGQLMIHNAWTVAVGDANDLDDVAAILRQQDTVIAGIYAARSGRPVDEFRTMMDAETWMTAERAVAEGLADEIVDAGSASNRTPRASSLAAMTADGVPKSTADLLAKLEAREATTPLGVPLATAELMARLEEREVNAQALARQFAASPPQLTYAEGERLRAITAAALTAEGHRINTRRVSAYNWQRDQVRMVEQQKEAEVAASMPPASPETPRRFWSKLRRSS